MADSIMRYVRTIGLPELCAIGDDFNFTLRIKNDAERTNHEINHFYLYVMADSGTNWQTDGHLLYNFPDRALHHYFFTPQQTRNLSFAFNLSAGSEFIEADAFSWLQTQKHARIATVFVYDSAGSFVVNEFGRILYSRVNPKIDSFDAARTSDESTEINANVKFSIASGADTSGLHAEISWQTREGTSQGSYTLTSTNISSALAGGVSVNLGSTFALGNVWQFEVSFTNSIGGTVYEESEPMTITVVQAFANVHLSGYERGGVCFGGFGSSNATNGALFESYYPIIPYNGIKGVNVYGSYNTEEQTGGKWLGKPIYRKVIQISSLSTGSHDISTDVPQDVDMLLSLRGMGYRESNSRWHMIPSASTSALNQGIEAWFGLSSGTYVIHINVGSGLSSISRGFIVLEYTKNSEDVYQIGNQLHIISGVNVQQDGNALSIS